MDPGVGPGVAADPEAAHDAPRRAAADELVDLVDRRNRVIGLASRAQVRGSNLLHRGVGILCSDSQGRTWVHRRTDTKDLFPGMYDMFIGGVVTSGETYLASARREIAEELGIRGPEPEYMFTHAYEDDRNRTFIQVYRVTWDGPVTFQPEEIAWGGQVPEAELEAWADRNIVPDGMDVFLHMLRWQREGRPASPSLP